ncbi:MAG: hypothetical protein WAN75_40580, partial [Xanthobacteraceae bacterium]
MHNSDRTVCKLARTWAENDEGDADESARQSWCDPTGERSYAGVADEVVPVRFSSTTIGDDRSAWAHVRRL